MISDVDLLARVVEAYHLHLKKSQRYLDALVELGIGKLALVSRYKLGYASGDLLSAFPSKTSKLGKAVRERLQVLGIVDSNHEEVFSGSLVIPVYNELNEVVKKRKTWTPIIPKQN